MSLFHLASENVQSVSRWFSDSDRQQINEAVAAAEARTSAEIVPAVANSSGRYDRPEDIVGLVLACITLGVLWFAMPGRPPEGDWGALSMAWQLALLIVAVVLAFMVGALIASRTPSLLRLFTPTTQMRDEVAAKARQVFYDQRIHHTAGAAGVLIYVSLFEHMVAVLADQVVLEKLGQQRIDELCRDLTARLRETTRTDAICQAIHKLGDWLADELPRADDDVNELPDALVMIDQ